MSEVKKNHLWGFAEFAKTHPECIQNGRRRDDSSNIMRFMCQCKNGHIFDYRNRAIFIFMRKCFYFGCMAKKQNNF